MNQERRAWTRRGEEFARKHPLLCLLLILGLAFLTGPLMIAANNSTAVLYKDF